MVRAGDFGYKSPAVAAQRQTGTTAGASLWGLIAAIVGALAVSAYAAATGALAGISALALLATAGLVVGVGSVLQMHRRAREVDAAVQARKALESLLASVPGVHLLLDETGERTRCSVGLGAFLGLAEAAPDVASLRGVLDEDGGRQLDAAMAALRDEGTPFSLRLRAADGRRCFDIEGRRLARPTDGMTMVLWLRDETEAACVADGLRAERAEMKAALDALPVPVWRRGPDLALAYCNRAYAEIVEATPEEAVASPGIELIGERDRMRALELARRARDEGKPQHEPHHVIAGGERRLYVLAEAPLPDRAGTMGVAWDITDLEEATRDRDRHIAAHGEVLERLSTAIAIFDADRRLLFFNGAYTRLWGLDEDWLRANPTYGEMLEALRAKRRLPEVPDFPSFKRRREALFTDLIEAQEELLHLPDERTLRMVVTPHPFGGLLFTFEDVTDTIALERSFNTLLAVQRATLDNLYEGVAVFGTDGRLKLSNPEFARLWNLEDGDLEDQPHIAEIVEKTRELYEDGGDWEGLKAHIIARTSDRTPSSQRLDRRDRSILHWASVPLPDGATLMTYLDVTDRMRVERALRDRAEAVETADRLKSEFIANISYELRTPLTSIIGFGELLAGGIYGALETRQNGCVDDILSSSRQLLQLIDNILDLALIEAGSIHLDLASFDLGEALAEVVRLVDRRARAKGIVVSFERDEGLDAVTADARRVKQAIFHLLTNAIKFSPDGAAVSLAVRREKGAAAITVIDSGKGIALKDQPHVFKRFWRAADTRERGTGLGLALVKSFIEMHGGEVAIDSAPGRGTRVICRLPLTPEAALEAAASIGETGNEDG